MIMFICMWSFTWCSKQKSLQSINTFCDLLSFSLYIVNRRKEKQWSKNDLLHYNKYPWRGVGAMGQVGHKYSSLKVGGLAPAVIVKYCTAKNFASKILWGKFGKLQQFIKLFYQFHYFHSIVYGLTIACWPSTLGRLLGLLLLTPWLSYTYMALYMASCF